MEIIEYIAWAYMLYFLHYISTKIDILKKHNDLLKEQNEIFKEAMNGSFVMEIDKTNGRATISPKVSVVFNISEEE